MSKKLILLGLSLCFLISASAQINLKGSLEKFKNKVIGPPSSEEIGMGLKEALNKGVKEGVDKLSATDGYFKSAYKILLPEEAQKVTNKLKAVPGFNNIEADLVEKLNRAAEDAAQKAGPIFLDAIKKMSFEDALKILMGEQNAATSYLESATYNPLYDEFRPVIIASLDKVNARSLWNSAVTAYNKIPLTKKVNPELDDYVAHKALEGLFSMVEKKELEIRDNPGARTSDLLKKVFAKQD